MSDELRLYKLIEEIDLVQERGWISTGEFCVWISWMEVYDFMSGLKDIFGYGLFDDGGFDANVQDECICISLSDALGGFLSLEDVFPVDEYQH